MGVRGPPSVRLSIPGRTGPGGGKANPRAGPARLARRFATRQAVPVTSTLTVSAQPHPHRPRDFGAEAQLAEQAFRWMRLLATQEGQVMAHATAGVFRSRGLPFRPYRPPCLEEDFAKIK